uniref:Metallophos domain-containing protein n=1 Tax=Parastrongyloides trichosuri TaxID=131310 RepID=A0A0N4Z3N7_PARTI
MKFITLSLLIIYTSGNIQKDKEKCYSCGSKRTSHLWPKREDNNYQYINELPFATLDNCDYVKNELPTVDCPNSVCAKIVLHDYDFNNDMTTDEDRKKLIIRDCWSRILNVSGSFLENGPYIERKVHLIEDLDSKNTLGYIFTCSGYLCNKSYIIKFTKFLIIYQFINYYIKMTYSMDYVHVDPLSKKPIELWKKYVSEGRISQPTKTLSLNEPIYKDKVRFVAISDTHEKLDEVIKYIPDGDVLLHAGDFTNFGDIGEIIKFNAELSKLPHKYKVVIAGNHELGFEDGETMSKRQLTTLKMLGMKKPYELLTNCIYLCDKEIELFGLKIYGTPWHPMPGYTFYRSRGQPILHKWNQIPNKIDVLITHTPPLGHGDFNSWDKCDGLLAGCAELLNTVEMRVKPKYHVFGHIHQRRGVTTNGSTIFINAAICDHKLNSCYEPIIFDIPLPNGISKEEWLAKN